MRPAEGILRRALGEEAAAWRTSAADFAKALLLLGLALVAALYSNASARSGQAGAAIVGAALALVLAIWVAWRFVPGMAAAVEWQWLPLVTRTHVTREGWVALGLTLIVGLTALNTSNNLLYMIFSALLACLALSLILAAVNLRALDVLVTLPPECFALARFPMSVTLHNRRALVPAFSIRVGPDDGVPFGFPKAYFPMTDARAAARTILETVCLRRGQHAIGRIRVESSFPFGLFVKSWTVAVRGELVAFPEQVEAGIPDGNTPDVTGHRARFEKGPGVDLFHIRDYQDTDSARHIDWKAYARTALLKTREFARDELRRVVIVLDRYGQSGSEDAFEHLVSLAASMVVRIGEADVACELKTDEGTWTSAPGASGPRSILRYLAVVRMSPDARVPRVPEGGEIRRLTLRQRLS